MSDARAERTRAAWLDVQLEVLAPGTPPRTEFKARRVRDTRGAG
jgi:hypothetical protein